MGILRFYSTPAFSTHKTSSLLCRLQQLSGQVQQLQAETCYHVELRTGASQLSPQHAQALRWLLSSPLHADSLSTETCLKAEGDNNLLIECGPRFNFSSADSSNAVQICQNIGLQDVVRLETSRRYLITFTAGYKQSGEEAHQLSAALHDRMTQCLYTGDNLPRKSFDEGLPKDLEPWFYVPLMEQGKKAMYDVNDKLGLAFDEWDVEFYTDLFMNKLRRNPTSVECFDLAQSNSEHSRHWFFKGRLVLDGVEQTESLLDMIMATQATSNQNNVIKFSDNSSAIRGYRHMKLVPSSVTAASRMSYIEVSSSLIFTAETHNMPTGVAPFSGATTGTGGRIRDVQAVGRGGHTVAGTAGYCVGHLRLPGYELPWEDEQWSYPSNFASPLEILIEASNGASDYGNKFGEPVICGFVQSYGMRGSDQERLEFVKPIMFSGGIGYMPEDMAEKAKPQPGHLVVKLGGLVYRIGVGGGAASSVPVQGDHQRCAALDFGAVQRGDAEMGNRLNRVVRACLEAGHNPILAIHDQGAGGNGNVLKELVEPEGAVIFTQEFQLGDPTITVLELWGAEYQENNALLCLKEHRALLEDICWRERCPVCFVGEVTGSGSVQLIEDSMQHIDKYTSSNSKSSQTPLPFNLHLDAVLGKMPRKVFELSSEAPPPAPLQLPADLTVMAALERVLRLLAVGSKRYLTNKVDRCVSGLVAQQQAVGPLHTPLADFAVIALSHQDTVGAATSIGTQSLKGLTQPDVGARMTVGEALTNLALVGISCLEDVKCSGNWMWSGKVGREGGSLAVACRAMCSLMGQLGVAVDGGKDSLSMAAAVGREKVKSPGTLVVSTYAPCPDITVKAVPALTAADSALLWVTATRGQYRLGGTALAQCYKQQGGSAPDVDDPAALKALFTVTQALLKDNKILSGHDISDGGFIGCLLELCFGGLRGVQVSLQLAGVSPLQAMFHEELGLLLEVREQNAQECCAAYAAGGLQCLRIGSSGQQGMQAPVRVSLNGELVVDGDVYSFMKLWEETSYRLELLQANDECVQEEWDGLQHRRGPQYKVPFTPSLLPPSPRTVRVAVIREEGSNGDREMMAALLAAHFEVYDVTMSDLLRKAVTLDQFQGLVFPGGFSYADTLGSAKGWAASILFSEELKAQFDHFALARKDTFSLGVCNGCQLMALLGWLDQQPGAQTDSDIVLEHNKSERFECRWSCVLVPESVDSGVWLGGMQGAQLGVWVAHGEGRFSARRPGALQTLLQQGRVCLQYVDDEGAPTQRYPMNPNGSPYGIAAVCSADGRHLAMMPHPERCFLSWQCPLPMGDPSNPVSPWQKMFNNAFQWATQQ